jgi:hypothetical protein
MGKRTKSTPLLMGLLEMTAGEPSARRALGQALSLGAKLRMGERAVALFALSLIEAARRGGPKPA